jgi:hypothetical protein
VEAVGVAIQRSFPKIAATSFTVAQMKRPTATKSGNMLTAIFANISDQLASFIRSVLLSGDVLATIAVGCGIIWESGPLEVHHVAHRLVIWGIIAETICTIGLFVFDNGMNDVQVAIIRAQNDRIEAQQKKIDDNEKVLIWQQMPRQLGQITDCRKILKASPKGARVRILWQSSVSDGDGFSFSISTCFSDPEHPWPPKWNLEMPQAVEKLPDGVSKTGITVIANKMDDWLNSPRTPGGFITKALREGALLHMGIGPLWLDPSLPDDEVIIAIGPKLP